MTYQVTIEYNTPTSARHPYRMMMCPELIRMNKKDLTREEKLAKRRAWHAANREKVEARKKIYRAKNSDKISKAWKRYYSLNKDRLLANGRRYHEQNVEKRRLKDQRWRSANRIWVRTRKLAYDTKKLKTDPIFKLKHTLRCRINLAIQKEYKTTSVIKLLGCSIKEFKSYIEKRFRPGMSWKNHSKTGWHLDHIRPLSSFDLTNSEQLQLACHYKNLQPLWAKDNLAKSYKY